MLSMKLNTMRIGKIIHNNISEKNLVFSIEKDLSTKQGTKSKKKTKQKEFEQTFAQRRYTNDNKHMKIFGTSLILKK